MPVALTYPGVYVEEIPSGVRTITGVATSITAFVGRAARGPVNEPLSINSFSDFESRFGGLWGKSTLGFAVRDFFRNGGSRAIIVRVAAAARSSSSEGSSAAKLRLTTSDTTLVLAAGYRGTDNPGVWGNNLQIQVDHNVLSDVATNYGLIADDLFNITVTDTASGLTEVFRNVTCVADHQRSIDKVLANGSVLVRVDPSESTTLPLSRPAVATIAVVTGGTDEGSDGPAIDESTILGSESAKTGLYALEQSDLFNILCIPPYTGISSALVEDADVDDDVISTAAVYCEKRRAFLVIDSPSSWTDKDTVMSNFHPTSSGLSSTERITTTSKNAALFFPRLRQPNPLRDAQIETFAACGAVAGIFARTDAQRGVWKAPAGLDAVVKGVPELSVKLTDGENGELNPLGVNCIRSRPPTGRVVWGARTVQGDDRLGSEWKYIPIRRLALFIEESLFRGTQWAVFEPNDEPLWAQIRLNVGTFMHDLFRKGAFQGSAKKDAYFVKCDAETTTQSEINLGIVNIVVGFAPLKPAEFVVLKIQQIAGQFKT